MLSVEEALALVLAELEVMPVEVISIDEAYGRVLAQDAVARHDLPPFANSAMDGYAVIAADITDPPVTLAVIEDIPAGYAPTHQLQAGQASRIMTGAVVPPGADAIVPVEFTGSDRHQTSKPDRVQVMQSVAVGDYIRQAGEDIKSGEVVLHKGRRLRPADVGVLAGMGFSQISVRRRPRVGILSTGDELLHPDEPLAPGKIRDMNRFTMTGLVQELGAIAVQLGIARDTKQDVQTRLQAAQQQGCDLILSSAGVSVGAFDVIKDVVEQLGSINFWKVNMRPGKPLTFGHVAGIPFLGLPGNPVSTMVSFEVFARPMILKLMGLDWQRQTQLARLGETMTSDGRMTFVRVQLKEQNGTMVAYTTGTQSSGAISSMVKADGLLVIPADVEEAAAGQYLNVIVF